MQQSSQQRTLLHPIRKSKATQIDAHSLVAKEDAFHTYMSNRNSLDEIAHCPYSKKHFTPTVLETDEIKLLCKDHTLNQFINRILHSHLMDAVLSVFD